MNRLLPIVAICCVLCAATLEAGNKIAGVHTTTSIVNGIVQQRTETIPHPNPLPHGINVLEEEKSAPIPNSGSINSTVRWIASDPTAIGQDVAIGANGQNPFVGWNLNSERVSFFDNTSNVPLWEYPSDPNVYRNYVALSANSTVIANASYYNLYMFNKSTGALTFNFPIPGGRIAGPVAVSRDGTLLVCATVAQTGGTHRVYAFNPPSATPIWTFDFSDNVSTGVYGINISADKSTVAVNGKFYGWILNANNGTLRAEMEIANTESRLAMSADASVLGIAELSGFIKAFAWSASQSRYNLLWQYKIPAGIFTNWVSAIDVSADGLTLMAGTLIFVTGSDYDGTVYMFDTFGEGQPNWIYTGMGDEVNQVALSDDGSIGAAASWGDFSNLKPDICIFERASNTPVYTVNTPGSMFSLAISADGKSVVAGGKAVHARQFGNGGNVYNIAVDLGGGFISGRATLTGAPNNGGAIAEVVGTTRRAVTSTSGNYVINNVPAGNYTVRISSLGYVAQSISNVTVTGTDTTRNVNATLAQAGAAPTNLVASHSQNSRIQLTWTNPTLLDRIEHDRLLAVDDYATTNSEAVHGAQPKRLLPTASTSLLVPPDSIRMYRGVRSGGPYYLKRTLSGSLSSFLDSTALPLKDYYYRVTAIYGAGQSIYSNEAYGTVDSSFLQFSITSPHRTVTPTINGTLAPGEWTDALRIDVSDIFGNGGGVLLPRGSAFMYLKYDSVANRLYIAGEDLLNTDGLADAEGFGLYFDDNNNNQFEPLGSDPLLREGNYWAYYFSSGSTVRFREIYTGGGVNAVVDTVTDAQVAMSSATGHFVGEVSIPLGFLNKNHLQIYGPNRIVGAGLFLIGRTTGGAAIFHGWWPQTMVSVFTPSGFGDLRIPIRLLAPPKAPTSVAVTRQGPRLRVTWTDPSQGLNNDPLTVPVTLQLYRNGTLYRQFSSGVQAFTDSSVVAQAWYEYQLRAFINISSTNYYGPYSETVGAFAVSDPQLAELRYDDGVPEVFYVVDFTYNENKFAIRFSPQQLPYKVYRVKAMTNNGNSPIMVEIHADSSGLPGTLLAGPYVGVSHQTAGIDSFLVTLPGLDPPGFEGGSFFVVLSYLPSSPGAPGIGGDLTPPIDGRSFYYTSSLGWNQLAAADLIVRAFVTGQSLAVGEEPGIPTEFALRQNYPNPFNPTTTIKFSLPPLGTAPAKGRVGEGSHVTLKVYDVLGREVATLVNEVKAPGVYSVPFNAAGLSSGVYFYRVTAGSFIDIKKMLLLK